MSNLTSHSKIYIAGHRGLVCAAWDFGILPDTMVVREIVAPDWREAVDACELLTSPAYHLLREWHGLPPKPFLGQTSPEIVNDPNLVHV